MKAAITGVTGFIGGHLRQRLTNMGYEILPLTRKELALSDKELAKLLEGCNLIVNLAGAPIAARHTKRYKKILYSSRIDTTNKLVMAMSYMQEIPRHFISASAVGVYVETGIQTESEHTYGSDYVAKLCRDWERAACEADAFTSVAIVRFGIVLGTDGGALPKMMLPFKYGIGGKIGNGRQMFSWIHLEDVMDAIAYIVQNNKRGVYNMVAPGAVTNREFTHVLATIMKKPAFFTVPVFMLRLLYGSGANTIAGGQNVFPEHLLDDGFKFKYSQIKPALEHLLSE